MAKRNPSIFLCHSYRDTSLIDLITRSLEEANFKIWEDADTKVGENWQEVIQSRLEQAKVFLLLITPQSLSSKWTQFEIGAALGRASVSEDVRIIPIILSDTEEEKLPMSIRKLDCLYAKNWNYQELIARIQERLKESTSDDASEDPNNAMEKHAR